MRSLRVKWSKNTNLTNSHPLFIQNGKICLTTVHNALFSNEISNFTNEQHEMLVQQEYAIIIEVLEIH